MSIDKPRVEWRITFWWKYGQQQQREDQGASGAHEDARDGEDMSGAGEWEAVWAVWEMPGRHHLTSPSGCHGTEGN